MATKMNYQAAIQWLSSRYFTHGTKLGLQRIQRLCQHMGNPHNNYPTLHIAGTNGKGSVSHYLSSVLTEEGYKTGLYISPHLEEFSERISIDSIPISPQELITLLETLRPLVDQMDAEKDSPSFFEITTALAFSYFYQKGVDIAVIEVGLGGTYDATNIITPEVSIITNISLEHTKHLGPTVLHIAKEKAGVIKPNVPILSAAASPAIEVIKTIAETKEAPFIHITKKQWNRIEHTPISQTFHISTLHQTYTLISHVLGEYQGENIALAVHALELLEKRGFHISKESILKGIGQSFNPGRMETYCLQPYILLDGAHNPAGIEMLTKALQEDYKYERLILIMGILKDKDLKRMTQVISQLADIFIATQPKSQRAFPSKDLEELIRSYRYPHQILSSPTIDEALQKAISIYEEKDLICVAGSLFTIGEARRILHQKNPGSCLQNHSYIS